MIADPGLEQAVDGFIGSMTDVLTELAGKVQGIDTTKLHGDVVSEAFNLAAAFVDCDDIHTDAELWSLIILFGPRMDSNLMHASPDDVRRAGLVGALRYLARMEKHHPRQPEHWYLAVLGTDPDHQGKGIGSALLQPVLERCDLEEVPAYLESSKEANIAFYARHGFELRDPIETEGGPTLYPMWREPRR